MRKTAGPAALAVLALAASPSFAGKADVIAAVINKGASGAYDFEVTVKSDETGWEKYADRWEVVAPDGAVLAVRVLLHPHVEEQPFTRTLPGIAIPPAVTEVTVRAHDKVEGFGGAEVTLAVPR